MHPDNVAQQTYKQNPEPASTYFSTAVSIHLQTDYGLIIIFE